MLLAIAVAVGPVASRAAENGPANHAVAPSLAAADKAAEAERLSKLAAQLAERAATLAAESQATAPASATASGTAQIARLPQPEWTSRGIDEVQISDTLGAAPEGASAEANGWRRRAKPAAAAIRFLDEPPAAQPAKTADAKPAESTSSLAKSLNLTKSLSLPLGADADKAQDDRSTKMQLLNDDHVRLAARTFQDGEPGRMSDAAPIPSPVPYNGRNGSEMDDQNGGSYDPSQGAYLHDVGCCDVDCCPPQRMLFWTAGVEATFLWPDLNSDGASFFFEEATEVPPREDWFGSTTDDVDSMYMSPRIWLGVQGCQWGANLRYWHLHASEGAFDPSLGPESLWDDYGAGAPDIGVFTFNRLEAYTIDLEVTRRFCLHDCWMQVSAGIRHAAIEHSEGITGVALGDDAILMGYGQAERYARGTGFVFGWYGRRPIFPCSCVHWFYNVRWSTMWGPTQTAAETGAMISVTDVDGVGTAGSVNGATTYVDDTLMIGEIQLGIEWDYALRCIPANAFFRAAVEYQRWDGGRGFSSATSFASVDVLGTETAYGEFSAAAAEPELELLGVTLSTGLTW